MIRHFGRQNSFVGLRTYLCIFISSDLLSVIIQAVGGGLASSAGGKDPPGNTTPSTYTILSGIIIQLVSTSCFVTLWIIFLWGARAVPISKIF